MKPPRAFDDSAPDERRAPELSTFMRKPASGDKTPLRFDRANSNESHAFSSFADLSKTVFDTRPAPSWPVWALLDARGLCVAGLQCKLLRVECEGALIEVAALRNIAVAAAWRGCGLMRDLLGRVLPWCETQAAVTLLFAEMPDLYTRFGFAALPQQAFEGPAPTPVGIGSAHQFDAGRDGTLLRRLLATRRPISGVVAIVDDGDLTTEALTSGDWPVTYDAALDALIAWEWDDDALVLVDVVAPQMPSAAAILGALGERPIRLRTMFPPDRLDWQGVRSRTTRA